MSWNAPPRPSTDGEPRLEIDTPYLARYSHDSAYVFLGPPPGDTTAAPVQIRMFDADGSRGTVRAREVRLLEEGARLEASGDARATVSGSDGATIQAQRIFVKGETIDAEGAVRAEVQSGGGSRIRAGRLAVREGGAGW